MPSRVVLRLHDDLRLLVHEIAKFGTVGAFCYLVDVGLFNLLVVVAMPHQAIAAKAISTICATTLSFFMNRYWTWSHRARTGLAREYTLFAMVSVVAVAITLGCLAFGEYVLNEQSLLARNFWGNVVGVGIAMVWRFWALRRWVFLEAEPQVPTEAIPQAA
jgi:putative flippase GtrA